MAAHACIAPWWPYGEPHLGALCIQPHRERKKKESLQFILQTAKNAMEARFLGFSLDMAMFMSDGADEMINAAPAVWLTVLWLPCY